MPWRMSSTPATICSAAIFDGRSSIRAIATSSLKSWIKVGQKSRLVLMTPAIVDFSKWLEDDDHSSIGDQVQVMARLARRKHGPRVHGFVGFCPLRQALYNDHRRRPGDKDPMSLVRAAIEAMVMRAA